MKTMTLFTATLTLLLLAASASHGAEIAVVVNPDNPVGTLDQKTLSRIFLGRAKTYPGGSKAVPLNQVSDSDTRSRFESSLLGRSSSQMDAYWAKQMFSGSGRPPEEVSDDSAVIARVSSDPEAIGYVDAGAVTENVKVVFSK